MNIPLIVGFLVILIFAIGVLIGQGLNGRTQIVRDKLQAEVQRHLNERRRFLDLTGQVTNPTPYGTFDPRQPLIDALRSRPSPFEPTTNPVRTQ